MLINATFRYYLIKESILSDPLVFIMRFIIFALAHSLFATRSAKQRLFASTSGREARAYRLIYNLASTLLFFYVMAAYRNSPVLYFAHGIWSLVMYAAQMIVAGILFNCVRQTGAADFLGIRQLRSDDGERRLVTSGCYARVRHPLYFLSLLFMVLNPVMTVQWLLLTCCSLVYFIVGACIEERRMMQDFGEEYRRYRQRVPFLLPGLKRWRKSSR